MWLETRAILHVPTSQAAQSRPPKKSMAGFVLPAVGGHRGFKRYNSHFESSPIHLENGRVGI
jgi:hypothetical protein